MKLKRAGGILLHPTSLPSPFGIGEVGEEAYAFIDFLAASRQKLWQILPLNPTGYGGTPYQSYSAFAGNPLLISLDLLCQEGFLTKNELQYLPGLPRERVDYPKVEKIKESLFRRAFRRWQTLKAEPEDYSLYKEANNNWLPDYALFMALKEYYQGLPWNKWDKPIARREKEALKQYRRLLGDKAEYHCFLQYMFDKQWKAVKERAKQKDLLIIGDLPLFISYDSSDTWVNPRLFKLDPEGNPQVVAGVPPDYFSPSGQRWGNPHYRWEVMAEDDYRWWRERLEKLYRWVDVIRLDHFRGLEAAWEIPAEEKTAVQGRWAKGPGEQFFYLLQRYMGDLPLIAEDLGFITPEVTALKNRFGLPGMKILQFTREEEYGLLPQEEKIIYYTGTHDNDTLIGWYQGNILPELKNAPPYWDLARICWCFVEDVFHSRAAWAIVPLQDLLGLDTWARMNTPGTIEDNWSWRFLPGSLGSGLQERLGELTVSSGRI